MPERKRQQRVQVLIACLALALFSLVLATGCSAQKAKSRQTDLKEQLTESVEAYWRHIRWGDFEQAANYVQEGEKRDQLWDYLMARRGKASLGEVEVYRVELAEDMKKGSASIKYQLILPNAESVEDRQVKQRWFTHGGRWYLEIQDEELKRLE